MTSITSTSSSPSSGSGARSHPGVDDATETPLDRALVHKGEGNALFSTGEYSDAARAYLRGLAELRWPPTTDTDTTTTTVTTDADCVTAASAGGGGGGDFVGEDDGAGADVGGGNDDTSSLKASASASSTATGAGRGGDIGQSCQSATGGGTTTSTVGLVQHCTEEDTGTCSTPLHESSIISTTTAEAEKMNLVSKNDDDTGDCPNTNPNSNSSSSSTRPSPSPTRTKTTVEVTTSTSVEERDEAARLRSNLALCYLRMDKYPLSEHESTLALRLLLDLHDGGDDHEEGNGAVGGPAGVSRGTGAAGGGGRGSASASGGEFGSRVAKVYYRRASARERMGRLVDAEDDVRRCLDLLLAVGGGGGGDEEGRTSKGGDAGMVRAARDALRRIGRLRTTGEVGKDAKSTRVGGNRATGNAAGEDCAAVTGVESSPRRVVGGDNVSAGEQREAAADGSRHHPNRDDGPPSSPASAATIPSSGSTSTATRTDRRLGTDGTRKNHHTSPPRGTSTEEDRGLRHQHGRAVSPSSSSASGSPPPSSHRKAPRPQPHAPHTPPRFTATRRSPVPPPERQLEIVRTLLAQSRRVKTTTGNGIRGVGGGGGGGYHVGEAYFVLDQRWWTRWCDHVRFFHDGKGGGGGDDRGRMKGDVDRKKKDHGGGAGDEKDDDDDDDSMSTATSSSSSTSSSDEEGGPPGVIDNSHLILPREDGSVVPADGGDDDDDDDAAGAAASDEEEGSETDEMIVAGGDGGGVAPGVSSSSSGSGSGSGPHRGRRHFRHDEEKKDESSSSTPSVEQDDPFSEWRRHGSTSPSRSTRPGSVMMTAPPSSVVSRHVSSPRRYVRLRPNLVRGYHYEILPREVYAALRSWYGEVGPSVCRRTEILSTSSATDENDGGGAGGAAVTMSTDDDVAAVVVGVRLYPELQHAGTVSSHSHSHSSETITTTSSEATTTGGRCGTCHAPATKRCTRCLSVFYCGRTCQVSHFPYHKGHCRVRAAKNRRSDDATTRVEVAASTVSTTSSMMLRSRWGRCGLGNLGNTCFMNSAVQCLSHVAPLTKFFLTNRFQVDINRTNPLGTGGCLALAYDATVKELWLGLAAGSSGGGGGGSGCITPSQLKRAISTFAPRFAGCSQHDAQEFLAYLLDGLHEDLNRVRDAPYVEMPDAGDGRNLRVAAAEAWDLYGRRNDSFVVDTFYGQFKSTCVCPDCGKVSVSFDAFNNISLELPQYNLRTMAVVLFRNNDASSDKWGVEPERFALTVNRGGCMRDVRVALSELCGINVDRLVLADIYESSIYELYPDNKRLSTVRVEDVVAAYEVDPFPSPTIHAIVTHVTKGQADAVDGDAWIKIGFPLLTSFDASLTCRQIREHLWRQVRRCVVGEEPQAEHHDDDAMEEESPQSQSSWADSAWGGAHTLCVRVTDQNGNPVPMFASHYAESGAMDTTATEEEDYGGSDDRYDSATRLPDDPAALPNSALKLADILGPECTERYLFLSIEWVDTFTIGKNGRTTVRLSANRFNEFVDHRSVLETRRRAPGNSITLDQCFEAFTRPERLDEHNMWYCSNCREHVRAMKTMELWKLPNVLVVHLKRFDHKHGFRRDKLETFVDFPIDGLDMSRHCSSYRRNVDPATVKADGAVETLDSIHEASFVCDEVPAVYDLFAVTNHYGRMGFGHYTAFARRWDATGIEKEWALFDDSSVRSVVTGTGSEGGNAVVTPAAYVLFYRRRLFT